MTSNHTRVCVGVCVNMKSAGTSAAVAMSSLERWPTPSCWNDQQQSSREHTAGFSMLLNTCSWSQITQY